MFPGKPGGVPRADAFRSRGFPVTGAQREVDGESYASYDRSRATTGKGGGAEGSRYDRAAEEEAGEFVTGPAKGMTISNLAKTLFFRYFHHVSRDERK